MRKVLLFILIFYSLFANCQNKWQTITYNDVSVQIPSSWSNKNTVNHYTDYGYTAYQISCWAIDQDISLIVQWIDVEVENDVYIKTVIEKTLMLSNFEYSDIIDTSFLNFKAKKSIFSFPVDNGNKLNGECISFINDGYSYIVMIYGDKRFYKSADYNKVLNSIKPVFSGITQAEAKEIQTSEISNNFIHYEFKDYSVSVPNTMELRNKNSFVSPIKEYLNDKISYALKTNITEFNFVFQPEGFDDIQNLEQAIKASSLYARVLISYKEGQIGDFERWNGNITSLQADYNDLNKIFKDNLLSESKSAKQTVVNLVSIEDIKIDKNANKFIYIKQSYIRTGLKGNVKVTDYYIYNNSEMVKLTISYRLSESNLWEQDFEKIIDTFSFNLKK